MPFAQPAQTSLVEVGTRVIVPDTSQVAVITTDPNWQGRVRVDWDEGREHRYRFVPPEDLVVVAPVVLLEPEEVGIPVLELAEPLEAAEDPWEEPWMDL